MLPESFISLEALKKDIFGVMDFSVCLHLFLICIHFSCRLLKFNGIMLDNRRKHSVSYSLVSRRITSISYFQTLITARLSFLHLLVCLLLASSSKWTFTAAVAWFLLTPFSSWTTVVRYYLHLSSMCLSISRREHAVIDVSLNLFPDGLPLYGTNAVSNNIDVLENCQDVVIRWFTQFVQASRGLKNLHHTRFDRPSLSHSNFPLLLPLSPPSILPFLSLFPSVRCYLALDASLFSLLFQPLPSFTLASPFIFHHTLLPFFILISSSLAHSLLPPFHSISLSPHYPFCLFFPSPCYHNQPLYRPFISKWTPAIMSNISELVFNTVYITLLCSLAA